jgi:hypothetical protein
MSGEQGKLFESRGPEASSVHVNERCVLRIEGEHL